MAVATKNRLSTNGHAAKAATNGHAEEAMPIRKKEMRLHKPVKRRMVVSIKGMDSVPLVMNKFSEKAMRQMADRQQKKASGAREAKNPEECFHGAMHLMPGAKATDKHPDVGFPAAGFRKAMVSAANNKTNGIAKTTVRGAVFVIKDADPGLVRIKYKTLQMREDAVRNDSGVADLRYRPQFDEWTADVIIEFDEGLISDEQVVNLMHRAGFSVGIGESRPEKEGDWGRWEVAGVELLEKST